MQIRAAQHNRRILEISVNYRRRIGGTNKVSVNFTASIKPLPESSPFSSAPAFPVVV